MYLVCVKNQRTFKIIRRLDSIHRIVWFVRLYGKIVAGDYRPYRHQTIQELHGLFLDQMNCPYYLIQLRKPSPLYTLSGYRYNFKKKILNFFL